MRGCTQCGECLNVCPVFRRHWREEYSPKAKRLLLEPVKDGTAAEGLSWDDIFNLARLCVGCGRCKQACARKLSTADLLADVRAAHPHWTQHLWALWIQHMGPLWPALGFLATLAPHGLTPKMLKPSLATARTLASPKRGKPWVRLVGNTLAVDAEPVVLFSGCTARNIRPQWRERAENLLRLGGYTLHDASAFTCCGSTMHTAGQYAAMNAMREANVLAWRTMGRPRITVFCASCFHGLAEYADGFIEGKEAEEWRRSLVPLATLLDGLRAEILEEKPAAWGYHQPCHWEKDMDLSFLSRVLPGLCKGQGICCGMGGILKLTDPGLSASMAVSCLREMPENTREILTGCSGCAIQLAAFAPEGVMVSHWLDVVDGKACL